jgi:hypothetical protein
LAAAPAAAAMSWYVGGGSLSGSGDYVESSLEAGLNSRTRSKWYSADRAWLFVNRTSYGLKTSTETSVTWNFGGGLDFKKGYGMNAFFWLTPAPRPLQDGSYRGRGAEAGLWRQWKGLIPGISHPSVLNTTLSLSGGQSIHEEYFITPIPTRAAQHWFQLRQASGSVGLTEALWGMTFVGGDVRAYAYDHDLQELSRNLEFLSLSGLGAANTYEMVLGFPRKSWGVQATQLLWTWGDLSGSWRRAEYVIGQTPRSDSWAGSLGIRFWRNFSVRGRYEVSRPEGGDAATYQGFSVEAGL